MSETVVSGPGLQMAGANPPTARGMESLERRAGPGLADTSTSPTERGADVYAAAPMSTTPRGAVSHLHRAAAVP